MVMMRVDEAMGQTEKGKSFSFVKLKILKPATSPDPHLARPAVGAAVFVLDPTITGRVVLAEGFTNDAGEVNIKVEGIAPGTDVPVEIAVEDEVIRKPIFTRIGTMGFQTIQLESKPPVGLIIIGSIAVLGAIFLISKS
jgi:hypothetical protein